DAITTACPIMLRASGELKPQATQVWNVGIFLIIVLPPISQFHAAVATIYMFLNRPIANSPLMVIYDTFGKHGYIWGLVLVTMLIWVIQYSVYGVVRWYRGRNVARG